MTTTYVKWGEAKVKLTWKPEKQCPQYNLITSVHGFCFYKNKLLLVNLNHRGWDFPGGHIELNETPVEGFKREAMEEGYVEGKCHILGYIVVDHNENPNWNENSSYPKVGYQLFYRMDVEKIHSFEGEYEASERLFIDPMEVSNYYHDWHELYQEILNYASTIA
ncbi:NUDIX domain-containing protein [Halobacillus amylolyticus]|uniref:NUDIX domain-containing protein n=1 Tax=Halobacillus amylolyticus TaxID=2932259 RepID=A0ABY4HD85_9BACI|nr:NUDIX domain-containing protein [Halobacillus amylolyticus]UOR12848.1 NUDIX domain-containing protein [Halobacillus amylolyticus]